MDQEQIQQWLAAPGTPQQVALRSRIVLATSAGKSNSAIARHLAINRKRVLSWQSCFSEHDIESVGEGPPDPWTYAHPQLNGNGRNDSEKALSLSSDFRTDSTQLYSAGGQ